MVTDVLNRHRRRSEDGVVALMVAVLSIVLMIAAGLAVDITMQTNRQQHLHDTLDAAAEAGAYQLPDSTSLARSEALAFAQAHDPTETGSLVPYVDFWCVVASTPSGATYVPDASQIPATCNPGSGPYTTATYPALRCNATRCAIPCPDTATCNTIRVSQSRDVAFTFGRAAGMDSGSTGALSSVACKGTCGSVVPNPMNVAVVADRTGSMSSTDINEMIAGIKGMLEVMTPAEQYVALGTIGRSATTSHSTATCNSFGKGLTWPSGSSTAGQWMPVEFSDDYLSGTALNTGTPLVKGISCLTQHSSTGTHLASPMKAAARYLLGKDANNLSTLPARVGTPANVIIFETDGQPNESIDGGSASLDMPGDIGAGGNGVTACNNLRQVAQNAKNANILVITIAYNLGGEHCGGSSTSLVTDTLAASASGSSVADNPCQTLAQQTAENSDGDYFFCAASGTEMAPIFKTALSQASKGIKLILLP